MIIECLTNEFISRLPGALADFETDEYMVALYGEAADLDADISNYTAVGEVSGSGYAAGGFPVTIIGPAAYMNETVFGMEDVTLPAITIQPVYGMLLYNITKGYSVGVYGCAPTIIPFSSPLTIRWNQVQSGLAPVRVRS